MRVRKELRMARPAGLEPVTSGLESISSELAQGSNELQAIETVRVGTTDRVQRVAGKAAIRRRLVTSLLQDAAENGGEYVSNSSGKSTDHGSNLGVRLMTVKEVATVLRVCTATVYGMVERGELEHMRVSNAIRVVVRLSP
jgi:excisionase family DNA binding protein